ncbi:hypothetical protein LTS18_013275, partial [Coniosporium uncinatum]
MDLDAELKALDNSRFPHPPARSPLRVHSNAKSSYFVDAPRPLAPSKTQRNEVKIPIQDNSDWPLGKKGPQQPKWQAPTDWDIFPSTKKETHAVAQSISSFEGDSPPPPPPKERALRYPGPAPAPVVKNDASELTHFQRFVKRMESAGPRVVLD